MLALQPHQSALYGQNMVTLVLLTIVLVFSVARVSSLDQEDDLCSLHSELNIDTSDGFHFFDIPYGAIGIDFKVKAYQNARIFLYTIDNMNDYYIVIIGRNDDTQSAIRECTPCNRVTIEATEDFLNLEEFRRFWVIFGNNIIKVGKENEETPFMSWDFGSYPRSFSYLGYPVGNPAVFQFCNFVYDIDVLSPSPSVKSSSSPSVPSSSDSLNETTSTTRGFLVADVEITSVLKGTSPHVSNYKEQTSHRPHQGLRGRVTLWPLAAVCVIPVFISVAIYVTIKRKQARKSTPEADETTKQHQSANPSDKYDMSVNAVNKTVDFEISDPTYSNYAYETVTSSQSDVQNVNKFDNENKYFPLDGTQLVQENENEYLTIR